MPAVKENPSQILRDGYHHLRHPEEYRSDAIAPAAEERLRALRERDKAPPLQSLKELWQVMKTVWKESGKAWDAERAEARAAKRQRGATHAPQP
jgi:hypothetical protein